MQKAFLADAAPFRLLPQGTSMGSVHIAVTDADAALAVWRDVIGLTVLRREDEKIYLGAGDAVLIVLHADAKTPVVPDTLGLYHVALHVPERRELARVVARALQAGVRVSPTDHLVTEALYLWDADGNGIEVTFETPWRGTLGNSDPRFYATTSDGQPHTGRERIDLERLMLELREGNDLSAPLPVGTRIGHVHVFVTDLNEAMRYYRDVIGFEGLLLLPGRGMGDAGLGYMPHAMAFNIWSGTDAVQPPEGTAGLRWFTIELPDADALAAVASRLQADGRELRPRGNGLATTDPFGNTLRLVVRG